MRRRKLLALALSLTAPGCGLGAILTQAKTTIDLIQDAAEVLDIIDAQVRRFFDALTEQQQSDYTEAMVATRLALKTAIHATRGAVELTEAERDAAFDDFRVAFRALEQLLVRMGVLKKGLLGAPTGPAVAPIEMPTPLVLR